MARRRSSVKTSSRAGSSSCMVEVLPCYAGVGGAGHWQVANGAGQTRDQPARAGSQVLHGRLATRAPGVAEAVTQLWREQPYGDLTHEEDGRRREPPHARRKDEATDIAALRRNVNFARLDQLGHPCSQPDQAPRELPGRDAPEWANTSQLRVVRFALGGRQG